MNSTNKLFLFFILKTAQEIPVRPSVALALRLTAKAARPRAFSHIGRITAEHSAQDSPVSFYKIYLMYLSMFRLIVSGII